MSVSEDAEWLQWVTKQFGSIAGEDKEINLEEFKTALQVKEPFFAERFFALFDADGSGTISLEELLEALSLLVHGNETDKLRFLFQVYDVDGSGSIDPDELRVVLGWCLQESRIALPEERLGALTLALFEAADKDHSGSITFEELREELEGFPDVMENLTISAASWLKPPPPSERSCRPRYLTRAYWHNHRSTLAFLGGYAGLNLLLFALAALQYAGLGGWVAVARGCGQCLNFNCAFLAVPMLRRCLTWLRATPMAEVLPLDQHIVFHQLVGYVVLGLAAVHTGAHIANFTPEWGLHPTSPKAGFQGCMRGSNSACTNPPPSAKCPPQVQNAPSLLARNPGMSPGKERCSIFQIAQAKPLGRLARQDGHHGLTDYLWSARVGGLGGTASQTGLALGGLLAPMFAFSSPCIRRSGHFEVFYWTHLSYISVWTLLLLHGPHFWKWFAVPGCLFTLEKVVGLARRRAGGLRIVEVNLLPSKVTHLVIQRPQFFHYKPGDYIYLNIPAIATYEWHPFTISSAPEQQETLWLHIRSLGQWTNKLYEYFQHPGSPRPEPKPLSRSLREKRCRRWAQVGADGPPQRARRMTLADGASSAGDAAAFGFQEGLCGRASSEGGSVATGGDGAIQLTSYKATGAAAPADEDLPAGEWLLPPAWQALRILILSGLEELVLADNEFPCPGCNEFLSLSPSRSYLSLVCTGPGETRRLCSIKCYIDGPFGTATRRIFTSEHAVLIGAGIGITPFASILQSIMFRLVPSQQLRLGSPQQTPTTSSDVVLGGTKRDVCHARPILRHFSWNPAGRRLGTGAGEEWGLRGSLQRSAGVRGMLGMQDCICLCRYHRRKQSCPSCRYSWCADLRDEEMTLQKVGAGEGVAGPRFALGTGAKGLWAPGSGEPVSIPSWSGKAGAGAQAEAAVSFQVDFIWINRDQRHFEWFISLLTKLELEQAEQEPGGRFLEMHMYMTSALSKNDMKAIGLQMALDLLATKEQRDSITGLRTRTQPGRPDWSKVFGKVAEEKRGKVQVFFCGSPALAKVIRAHCERFGFRFFKENF
ncbi:NADPH oxidase 5-like [Rhynochetos jubatus]